MDTGDYEHLKKQNLLQEFSNNCHVSTQLFLQKNEEYGDAIDAGGLIGAVVEIIGIAARLMVLVLHSPDGGKSNREQIWDKLQDLHNYANIAAMMTARGNFKGEIGWFQKKMEERIKSNEKQNHP
jgi:gas vesicle protein